MKKKISEKDNLLDYVPVKYDKIETKINDNGLVDIIIPRDGWFDSLIRKIAKTPDKKVISLDSLGSGVWNAIDNKRNLYDISKIIKNEFGADADPLYDRLSSFIRLLSNNEFIKLNRVDD